MTDNRSEPQKVCTIGAVDWFGWLSLCVSPVALHVLSIVGIVRMNYASCDSFGTSRKDLICQHLNDVVFYKTRPDFLLT